MNKKCEWCGEEFESSKHPNQLCCCQSHASFFFWSKKTAEERKAMGKKVSAKTTRFMVSYNGKRTKEYKSYTSMIERCYNPKVAGYKHYGGRGITVCESWNKKGGFQNFIKDMGPSGGKTIDRINPDGNYDPLNCRWATYYEQANNKRPTKKKGIRFHRGWWEATISVFGSSHHIGIYREQKEAQDAYNVAHKEWHGKMPNLLEA